MVAFGFASVKFSPQRGDIARDGFDRDISDGVSDRRRSFRFDLPAGTKKINLWSDDSRTAGRRSLGKGGATFHQVNEAKRRVAPPFPSSSFLSSFSSERITDFTLTSSVPRRWNLLDKIQRLCRPEDKMKRGPAVCGCGRPGHLADSINVHLRAGKDGKARAGVSGVYRCGSPWLCPTCAPGKALERAERVQEAARATYDRGGNVVLVVLTASHSKTTPLAEIKALVATASRKARSGKAWKTIENEHGVLGVVVGQEVTFSRRNGSHYHQHLSVFVDGDDEAAMAAGQAVAARYRAEIERAGGKVSGKHGCFVRVAVDAADASDYTAKGSAAWEVAGGPGKTGTKAKTSLTPWDVAEFAFKGDEWARDRWSEYVKVMPGTRSCVISARLAKALEIATADDRETGEQVVHEADELIGQIQSQVWRNLIRASLASTFLARVEIGGEMGWEETKAWATKQSDQVNYALGDDDDVIPFEAPLIKYGPPPALPPAPTIQMPAWQPSPPIIRSPRPPKPTPRFRKPAFLTSWCKAAEAA